MLRRPRTWEGLAAIRLDRVLAGVPLRETRGDLVTVEVSAVTFDISEARPGALHCCLPGSRRDGHDLAGGALAAGAVALLVERPLPLDAVQAVVAPGDGRPAMAEAACALHGRPAEALATVGVTGTNGKT
ncbi:MAG: Mur ligase domain-containing protein, partial [Acidimicrobiales bacterium]